MKNKNESLRILHKYLKKAERRVEEIKISISLIESSLVVTSPKIEPPKAADPDFYKKAKVFIKQVDFKKETKAIETHPVVEPQIIQEPSEEKTVFPLSMDSNELLNNLKALRVDAGQTQQFIADTLGVHFTLISNWERGSKPKDIIDISKKLAKHFNIQLKAIVLPEGGVKRPYTKRDKEPKSDPDEV